MKIRTTLNRKTAPACYTSPKYKFVNTPYDMWIHNGNCTHYAYARSCELAGHDIYKTDFTSLPDAGGWYKKTKWNIGTQPRAGAIGECENHVFIVERVNEDGTYLISESSYNDFIFNTRTINTKVGEIYAKPSGKLLHFIYNPYVDDFDEVIDLLARDVIAGKYGNNPDRKNNIYKAVQNRVNEILKNE